VKIACALDRLGVGYIEGGWPGSNPKDAEFFQRIREVPLAHARVAAFGSTRRAGIRCEEDGSLLALVEADTPVVTLVGKSSTLHVDRVLETSRDENLRMIGESVAFFKRLGREVIYDADTSSTAPGSMPDTRSPRCARQRMPAPMSWSSATPTAASCPTSWVIG